MNENLEKTLDNTSLKKEARVNINVRLKESLKNKIIAKRTLDNKTPDEFFSDMFYAYLKEEAKSQGDADYSNDIEELHSVVGRIITIYQNMIDKTYMYNSIKKETYSNEMEDIKTNLTKEYEKKISLLQKECDKAKKEYEMISEQAQGLLSDTRKLKENLNILESNNEKNEELLKTYKEQIESLKIYSSNLEEKLKGTVDENLLEKVNLEKERALLEKDRHYQSIINSMQEQYNHLQTLYTSAISSSHTPTKQS